jgi:hypothetical protein
VLFLPEQEDSEELEPTLPVAEDVEDVRDLVEEDVEEAAPVPKGKDMRSRFEF